MQKKAETSVPVISNDFLWIYMELTMVLRLVGVMNFTHFISSDQYSRERIQLR